MSDNTITHFVVLFTAQKTRKRKVWQDGKGAICNLLHSRSFSYSKLLFLGTMKYYSFNRKVLYQNIANR